MCTVGFPVRCSLEEGGGQDTEVGEMALCDVAGLFTLQDYAEMTQACKLAALRVVKLQNMSIAAR